MGPGEMVNRIPLNRPVVTGREIEYINEVLDNRQFAGDGPMSRRCNLWLTERLGAQAVFVTSSCTGALEMAAMLCNLQPGDEVILPSFAFSSTATAFARAGASLVYVDIEPETMNIDASEVEAAITDRTRAIVALHYGGVGCAMTRLCDISRKYDLFLVEDAAQGILSNHGPKPLGTIGTFGCISFHESKNIHCGEGGALVINDPGFIERAEIILQKGTNRIEFQRGGLSKYTWCDLGSSYVLSDINCAYLLAQLEEVEAITTDRLGIWSGYRESLQDLADRELIEIPLPHSRDQHNGHIFWVKLKDMEARERLQSFLNERQIMTTFHYIPLHSAPAGLRYGRFSGRDSYTTSESERLLRLPLYYGLNEWDRVVDAIYDYFS